MCVCSIYVTLLKDCEVGQKAVAWAHMLQGTQDFSVGAVFLQDIHVHQVKVVKATYQYFNSAEEQCFPLILIIRGIKHPSIQISL